MATSAKGALTPKQSAFVEEYLKDLNATQAAIRAGYSVKTANEQAARLLAKVSIQDAIQAAMDERSKRTEIDQDYVLRGIQEAVERSMQHRAVAAADGSPVVVEGPDGELCPVYAFDAKAALKGYELLGKHLKMFTDKHEHTGEGGGPVQTMVLTKDDYRKLRQEMLEDDDC